MPAMKIEWAFSEVAKTETTVLENDGVTIYFHPNYSRGTAAVRGESPLLPGFHHFWELEMVSPVYGTDVMVGIGTVDAAYNKHASSFTSVIGIDDESWGFSYRGAVYHGTEGGTEPRGYGSAIWKEGSCVGIHYDAWNSTVEFYQDKRPQGIAFRNIPKDKDIFPMVASTAARSKVRLVAAQSYPTNLAFECVNRLRKQQQSLCRSSLYAKNNLLLADDRADCPSGRGRWWTDLNLPPGILRFINDHCWYLVGGKLSNDDRRRPARLVQDETDDTSGSEDFVPAAKRPRKSCCDDDDDDESSGNDDDDTFGLFRTTVTKKLTPKRSGATREASTTYLSIPVPNDRRHRGESSKATKKSFSRVKLKSRKSKRTSTVEDDDSDEGNANAVDERRQRYHLRRRRV